MAHQPLWTRLPGWAVVLACLWSALWLLAAGPRGALAWLFLGLGLALGLGLGLLPTRWTLAGTQLEERGLLRRRLLALGPGARARERRGERPFLGTVARVVLEDALGQRVRLESYLSGFHPMRARLAELGLLAAAPAAAPAPVVPGSFEVRLRGQDRALLALLGLAGAGATLAGAWGLVFGPAWSQAWGGLLLAAGACLAWSALASLAESLVTYRVEGELLVRRHPLGARAVEAARIRRAEERWQWNGGDRTLTVWPGPGRPFRVDSACEGYGLLLAWLRARGRLVS